MAIKTEFFKKREDGENLVRTYSDNKDKWIKKIGTEDVYDEAVDVGKLNSNNEWESVYYSYEEIEIKIGEKEWLN